MSAALSLSRADADGIDALIDRYQAAWNALDAEGLRNLWDPDVAEPWCLPEEIEGPLIGWPMLTDYWRDCQALIARFGLRIWDRRAKLLGPDIAVVMFMMKWTATLAATPNAAPIGGTVKVSITLRRASDWRFVHYMEAALGPMPFIRIAYEQQAEPALFDR